MRGLYAIAFLLCLTVNCLQAQDICNDPRYVAGGFTLSSLDICHDETLTITNSGGVEDPKYYFAYNGQSYEEVHALGTATLDYSSVRKPGIYRAIQVGTVDGQPSVSCQQIRVRHSNTAVFSYNFCTSPTPRIEIIIPQHPINEQFVNGYNIDINGTVHQVNSVNVPLSFPVTNQTNTLKVTGLGGRKVCSADPFPTVVPPFNANGQSYEFYPEIKRLQVQDDNSIKLNIQGQYLENYNLFRFELGQPNLGLQPVKTNLKTGTTITDLPPDPSRVYCYYIKPATAAQCGLFSLQSASICSVPLSSPTPPTTASNYLSWLSGKGESNFTATADLITITDESPRQITAVNLQQTYQHNHNDCSKRHCYRVSVSFTGTREFVRFAGTSLSNQLCFDHRIDLTDYPSDAFVTTEQQKNTVHFDPTTASPYRIGRWEVFKKDSTEHALMETVMPGPAQPFATDAEQPLTQHHAYKVRYVDECDNVSPFSPEIHSLFLWNDDNNVLHWNEHNPFADSEISHYEVIYYNADNSATEVGRYWIGAGIFAHSVNKTSITNVGTFQIRAVSTDGREAFSNLLTFEVRGTLYLPTAFTPNGDAHNPTFRPEGSIAGIRTFHLEIFSSNGQKVADITDPNEGWNGLLPNGTAALFGSYLYRMRAEMTNGHTIDKNGSFVLLY